MIGALPMLLPPVNLLTIGERGAHPDAHRPVDRFGHQRVIWREHWVWRGGGWVYALLLILPAEVFIQHVAQLAHVERLRQIRIHARLA